VVAMGLAHGGCDGVVVYGRRSRGGGGSMFWGFKLVAVGKGVFVFLIVRV
jgi:hypothetical protein